MEKLSTIRLFAGIFSIFGFLMVLQILLSLPQILKGEIESNLEFLINCFRSFSYFFGGLFLDKKKNWARLLLLVVCSYEILQQLCQIIIGSESFYRRFQFTFTDYILEIGFFIVFLTPIIYLTRPKVKEQFK